MRPTDENQHGFNRPNLMSAEPKGGNEDNILAMLERGSDGGLARGGRVLGYGAAGLLAFGLFGALVWLLYDNETTRHADQVIAKANADASMLPAPVSAPEVHAHAEGAAIVETTEATAPTPGPQAPDPAAAGQEQSVSPAPQAAAPAVADQRPPPSEVTEQENPAGAVRPEPPPLVLLSPQEAAAARGEPLVKRTTQQPVLIVSEAPPAPDRDQARPQKGASQRAQAASPRAAKPAGKRAAPATRPPQRLAAAKTKKAPPAAVRDEAPPDHDVALISAIIMGSGRHATEREAAEKADKLP